MMFSIVIPVHGSRSVHRPVSSLLRQHTRDLEVVVVTDLCEPVLSFAPACLIRHIHLKERSERAIARTKGMQAAVGDWICWLDSDDEYSSHYLHVVKRAIEQHPDARCFNFGAIVHHKDGTSLRQTFRPKWLSDRHEDFKSGKIGSGSFVFHRSVLDEIEPLPQAKNPYDFHKSATDVHHLYPVGGHTLGNPWGDDYLFFLQDYAKVSFDSSWQLSLCAVYAWSCLMLNIYLFVTCQTERDQVLRIVRQVVVAMEIPEWLDMVNIKNSTPYFDAFFLGHPAFLADKSISFSDRLGNYVPGWTSVSLYATNPERRIFSMQHIFSSPGCVALFVTKVLFGKFVCGWRKLQQFFTPSAWGFYFGAAKRLGYFLSMLNCLRKFSSFVRAFVGAIVSLQAKTYSFSICKSFIFWPGRVFRDCIDNAYRILIFSVAVREPSNFVSSLLSLPIGFSNSFNALLTRFLTLVTSGQRCARAFSGAKLFTLAAVCSKGLFAFWADKLYHFVSFLVSRARTDSLNYSTGGWSLSNSVFQSVPLGNCLYVQYTRGL